MVTPRWVNVKKLDSLITNLHIAWNHGFIHDLCVMCDVIPSVWFSWIHDQNPWCRHHTVISWMLIMDPWKPHLWVHVINETWTVNTQNRSTLFGDHANRPCAPVEPSFTPLWHRTAANKSICTGKGILRESSVNLRGQIIKQHVLKSEIEKSRAFWFRNSAKCG